MKKVIVTIVILLSICISSLNTYGKSNNDYLLNISIGTGLMREQLKELIDMLESKYLIDIGFSVITAEKKCYNEVNFSNCIKDNYFSHGVFIGLKLESEISGDSIKYHGIPLDIVTIVEEKYKIIGLDTIMNGLGTKLITNHDFNINKLLGKLESTLISKCNYYELEKCNINELVKIEEKRNKDKKTRELELKIKQSELEYNNLLRKYYILAYTILAIILIYIIKVIYSSLIKRSLIKKILNLTNDLKYYNITLSNISTSDVIIEYKINEINNIINILINLLGNNNKNFYELSDNYEKYSSIFREIKEETESYKKEMNLNNDIDNLIEVKENFNILNERIKELSNSSNNKVIDKDLLKHYLKQIGKYKDILKKTRKKLEKTKKKLKDNNKISILELKIKNIDLYIHNFEKLDKIISDKLKNNI